LPAYINSIRMQPFFPLRRRLQGLFGRSFQLELRSEIGEGTTVTMRIPLRKRFGPRSRNDDAGTGDPAALQIVVSGDDVIEPVGAARADIEDASLNCIEQVRSRSF
jgi:hypothetical protein